jgi:hypothetical protein
LSCIGASSCPKGYDILVEPFIVIDVRFLLMIVVLFCACWLGKRPSFAMSIPRPARWLKMDEAEQKRFIVQWRKYFGDADLPITAFFSDKQVPDALAAGSDPCVISALPLVKEGKTFCFSATSRICGGAKRYFGFREDSGMRDFEYFLSYGIPGKIEGERYKKSPEIVRESMKISPHFKAPKKFIVFKRWDKLSGSDEPEIVIFLADLDTISGLFALANFDEADPNGVICPFGSGCASIVYYPYMESKSAHPRCVMGMFDISARPCIGENSLSFSAPYSRFRQMVENIDESFLTTGSWKALSKRH